MGLFSKFKKSAKAVAKQNVLEGIVAAQILVAGASGSIDKKELETVNKLLDTNDSLNAFSKSDKQRLVSKYSQMVETNYLVGKTKLLREIAEVANNPEDAEDIFVNAIAIAQADGDLEANEAKILVEIGNTLGLELNDYGIEVSA